MSYKNESQVEWMKVGMIGIGDIAMKAYLPVLSRYKDLDLHLCTRNKGILEEMAQTYNISQTYEQVETLVQSGIEAAFVHSTTASHEAAIDLLLDHDIHVYVDKPITFDGASAKRLVEKARAKGLVFMVGFNRRFAPPYDALKELDSPNLILVEKHRAHHPDDARTFVFNDFIHVIDTMLYLFPYKIENYHISGKHKKEMLYHVMLQLEAEEGTAIGIMNRDAGMNEEFVKVSSPEETRTVKNINEVTYYQGRAASIQGSDDWEPTLFKRGFHHMTRAFIDQVKNHHHKQFDYEKDLQRHLIAEKVVQYFLKTSC